MTLNQHIRCSRLAKLLDVSPRTIRNWASDPTHPLPGKLVNGVWLFELAEVERWLNEIQESTAGTDAAVEALLGELEKECPNGPIT